MNSLAIFILGVVAWVAVFAQTQFAPVREWLGTPISVLPALAVYAALTHPFWVTLLLSIWIGIGQDALSSHRVGVSIIPYCLIAALIDQRRHLILRDQYFAQFCLGGAASVGISFLTWLILSFSGREPILGWGTLWQVFVNALINGWVCPLCFAMFGSFRRIFEYQELAQQPFPTNREIKRGRR